LLSCPPCFFLLSLPAPFPFSFFFFFFFLSSNRSQFIKLDQKVTKKNMEKQNSKQFKFYFEYTLKDA